jgi:hypothetical protein
MSASLIDLAKQYITPDVIDKLAAFTGETPAATSKAMAGAAPALLAGMLNTAQGSGGVSQLLALFQQGKFDGGMLGNLAGAFSGGSADSLLKVGTPLLSSLFGARSNALTDMLASFSGVKRSSSASLLALAAPFVMSLVGKQLASSGGVNANSLQNLLSSQRGAVASAAPPGLAQALGLGDLSSLGANNTHHRDNVPPVRREESSVGKWLPWLIGLAALLLLFSWMRGCGKAPAAGMTTDTVPVMTGPAPRTVDTTVPMVPATGDTTSMRSPSSGGAGNPSSGGTGGAAGGMAAPAGGNMAQPSMSAPTTAPATAPAAAPAAGNQGGVGAMGGRGADGKEVPTAPAPTAQPEQKP